MALDTKGAALSDYDVDVPATRGRSAASNLNALRLGAAKAEVIQVVEIVGCLGMQSYLLGIPSVLRR